MKEYQTIKDITECFSMKRDAVERRVKGIRKEIVSGRYNEYAISGRQINIYVFIDYNKYFQELENPKYRPLVPAFDASRVKAMLPM